MGRRCVFGCSLPKPLFPFPKTPWLRTQWLEFVHFEDSGIVESSRLCSRHFTPDCFKNLIQHEMGFAEMLLLTESAIPSVYTVGASPRPKPITRDTGCQYDYPSTKTAGIQVISPRAKRRSKAVQVKPLGRCVTVSVSEDDFTSAPAKRPRMEELSEQGSCASDVWDYDFSQNEAIHEWNGETALVENELELTRSMTHKPSAALQPDKKDFPVRSFSPDEEESSGVSQSRYVNLSKEVLVLLMFRCLECSSECRICGKGKGGNLSLRQECLMCCNSRVWTSRPAHMQKEVAVMHLRSAGRDGIFNLSTEKQKDHENNTLKQTCRDRLCINAVPEEAHAAGNVTSFVVKEENEDEGEREVESLLMETYMDKVLFSSAEEKPDIEGDGFTVASVKDETVEPTHTSLTAQEDAFPEEDSRNDQFSGQGEQDDSEESLSSSFEPTDSSEEERSGEKRQKLFQNTIKPIYWCVDCRAVALVRCKFRRHQKIFGCSECGAGDDVVGYGFRGFTVHFSDKHSFHKHAIEVHGATENLHERTVCQECNKTFRVQSDPSKKGHVCEYKVKPFSCHLCHKRFATENGQKVHYRRLHRDYTHLCKFCMEVFDTRRSKLEHEQTHGEDQLPSTRPDT